MSMTGKQAILSVLALVPAGYVVSYGQLADLAGLPGRARLAGTVLRRADTSALPWHRVVASSGHISLPADSREAREQKERLLTEGVVFRGNKVDMKQHQWRPDLGALLVLLDQ
ncbi:MULTISPECIES: MGMT family protein [Oceanimonas]|uniref:MGMT family protein n=1 Tax=Oceanimonas smirnovii TaxID=264574 RepID=A0ABW7P2P9_9GAMM|nr:MGMT family protein [Oceanimonas sp. CAM02]MDV2858427.1 MGMT family protein [Oceanimonas sp. CAM02]